MVPDEGFSHWRNGNTLEALDRRTLEKIAATPQRAGPLEQLFGGIHWAGSFHLSSTMPHPWMGLLIPTSWAATCSSRRKENENINPVDICETCPHWRDSVESSVSIFYQQCYFLFELGEREGGRGACDAFYFFFLLLSPFSSSMFYFHFFLIVFPRLLCMAKYR